MRVPPSFRIIVPMVVVTALGAIAVFTREQWQPLFRRAPIEVNSVDAASPDVKTPSVLST